MEPQEPKPGGVLLIAPYRATLLFRQVTDGNQEEVSIMVESRTPLELGIACARMYLEQAFGYDKVELIEPPDGEDRNWTTRSFWINIQGPQRIYFTTQVLEDERDPRRVLQNLQGWELADYIRQVGRVPVIMTTDGPKKISVEEG
jgi:hypothetical protein